MQDKFYSIRPAVSTEETGKVYPQAGMTLDYDKHKPDSFTKLKSFQLPDFIPDFDHFVLDYRAYFTDLISGSIMYYGLLCSKELLDVILDFNIQEHAVFNAFVSQGDRCEEYFWLHLGENEIIHLINYSLSDFILKKSLIKQEGIKIESYENYWIKLEEFDFKTIKAKSLVFNNDINYDLFVVPFFDGRIFISDRLKEAIRNHKFTGIEIKMIDNIKMSVLS